MKCIECGIIFDADWEAKDAALNGAASPAATAMPDSLTPRSDALALELLGSLGYGKLWDHARQLERELAIQDGANEILTRQLAEASSASSAIAHKITGDELALWLKAWWVNNDGWRAEMRQEFGPDIAQHMRGVADMIEQPWLKPSAEAPPTIARYDISWGDKKLTIRPDHKGAWVQYTDLASSPAVFPALPEGLHPTTKSLVFRFACALADKLHAAEKKYGYSDLWAVADWEDECRERLHEHLQKGDPRDVANYCAFMWHHGWSTKSPSATERNDFSKEK